MKLNLKTTVFGTTFFLTLTCAVAFVFGVPVKEGVIEVTTCVYLVISALTSAGAKK